MSSIEVELGVKLALMEWEIRAKEIKTEIEVEVGTGTGVALLVPRQT